MGSEICQPGEYCTTDGKKTTDMGFYTFNKASISQIPCPIGTFQNRTGQNDCVKCTEGNYCPST